MIQDLDSLFHYSVIVECKKGAYPHCGAFKRLQPYSQTLHWAKRAWQRLYSGLFYRHHDTQYNDVQRNDTQRSNKKMRHVT